jgi:hypothetical protein
VTTNVWHVEANDLPADDMYVLASSMSHTTHDIDASMCSQPPPVFK